MRSSPKKAYAHFFTPFPISMDNAPSSADYYATHYLAINGEGGKHAAYGGFLRQRPLPRAPIAGSTWYLEDMKTEVRRAIAAGLDGFTVNMMGLSGVQWDRLQNLLTAAAAVDPGFDIVLMPDAATSVVADRNALAAALATLAAHPSVGRLADGRLIVSPFYAEGPAPRSGAT
ncbi:MAG: hypothetical protein R2743_22560 [Ilumatobacteraceae bacterium]